MVLLRALRETWSRHTFAEAFVILGSLVTLLPPGDQRWVDVLDALPENVEWASSYNRIAFDTALGVTAFREIERTLKRAEPIDPGRLAQVNSYLAGLLGWCLGEVDEAAARAAAAVELFERAGDGARARAAGCELSWMEGLAGRYAAQETATRRVLAAAEGAADHQTTLVALVSLATTAHIRGDDDTAVGRASTQHRGGQSRAQPDAAALRSGDPQRDGGAQRAAGSRPAAAPGGRETSNTIPVTRSSSRPPYGCPGGRENSRWSPAKHPGSPRLCAPTQKCWLLDVCRDGRRRDR